jgi:hypothetical protein
MKCACPWCSRDAEEGYVALVSGRPCCKEHGFLVVDESKKESDRNDSLKAAGASGQGTM